LSTAGSDTASRVVFEGGGHRRALVVRRHPRARGMKLRVDPRDGAVVLSLPPRANLARAERWAEGQRDWVEAQLSRVAPDRPVVPGAPLPYRGETILIDWEASRPRTPRLEGERLRFGGPEQAIETRVLRWLKAEARRHLSEETAHYAALADVPVAKISIGDPKTRWGSCSSSGAIRYNWRLVMAPPRVLSATAAHEVAHRVHMNHGPRFHALVRQIFGADPSPERKWLKENGAALYRIGRSS
jgi:predicted metal-dependent hydrolase